MEAISFCEKSECTLVSERGVRDTKKLRVRRGAEEHGKSALEKITHGLVKNVLHQTKYVASGFNPATIATVNCALPELF